MHQQYPICMQSVLLLLIALRGSNILLENITETGFENASMFVFKRSMQNYTHIF